MYEEDFIEASEQELMKLDLNPGPVVLEYMTLDYCVHVVDNQHGQTVYRIVNRATQVDEIEDHLLPRVLNSMLELQKNLDEATAKFNRPSLTLIGDSNGEGEGSIH